MKTTPPQRILIVRLSAIGDVVFASPLLEALHRTYPEAQISWLAEPAQAPLLESNPLVHEVIRWSKNEWRDDFKRLHWLRLASRIIRFRRLLRDRRFDLVIDIQGLMKSAFLARLTGAKERVGFASKEPTGWLMTRRVEKDLGPRISSEYLGMAQSLGLDVGDFRMHLALSDTDYEFASQVAEERPYLVCAPFTTRPQKHWTEAHWRSLIQKLLEAGERVLILGGPADTEAAERIIGEGAAESLAGRATLTQSAAVIAQARALIGVDTGLTHMSIAHGRPTVALFGSTVPYLETTRSNARVIYHDLPCAPCRRNPTCGGRFDCMSGIEPEEVLGVLRDVMAEGPATNSQIPEP